MADEGDASPVPVRDESPTLTLAQRKAGATPPTPDVRLYHRAVVAPMEPPLRCGGAARDRASPKQTPLCFLSASQGLGAAAADGRRARPRMPPPPGPRQPLPRRPSARRGLVRQLSIDQLDNEGRRVSIYDKALPTDGPGAASTGAPAARRAGPLSGVGPPAWPAPAQRPSPAAARPRPAARLRPARGRRGVASF
jgi:hypothetical protein